MIEFRADRVGIRAGLHLRIVWRRGRSRGDCAEREAASSAAGIHSTNCPVQVSNGLATRFSGPGKSAKGPGTPTVCQVHPALLDLSL